MTPVLLLAFAFCMLQVGAANPFAGEPAVAYEVVVEQPHGARFSTRTDRNGNFSIANIAPGMYSLKIRPANDTVDAALFCRILIEGVTPRPINERISVKALVPEYSTKAEILYGKISGRISLER